VRRQKNGKLRHRAAGDRINTQQYSPYSTIWEHGRRIFGVVSAGGNFQEVREDTWNFTRPHPETEVTRNREEAPLRFSDAKTSDACDG
jgi:hypothetical protein